ncbi:MAG: hypothetical protein A2X19_02675 [Bacteroidetes bacterium GWE2_39_28]|nr:MAG: hypothetical protein A2X19_02675 [Bacteroidetes bacterium GWE2_39_28]OFY16175.1 MAG: hypothetical protein A2X16_03280 [Bacteroidetes bacterium GWF2_39_10]OFZ06996.1 MAG: hypothetical protein A2322_08490 [Bacteroidetes bacterium RIFOXYB2_FULL_39_7]OFZ09550.1 MAG: hypothetical protein A2465_04890 [Bacteroidetes bacterium RIFOXYC2_FULL_39_11]HCT94350.1 hypothetical protein [Rikenellaceae bacterium]
MQNLSKKTKALHKILGVLLAFGALNAFGGGWYGMSGAEGVPVEWLDESPFSSYFIPSLILFIAVGGSFLTASVMNFAYSKYARTVSLASVGVVFIWLIVQLIIIGYVSWMQPTTATFACGVLILSILLPDRKGKL